MITKFILALMVFSIQLQARQIASIPPLSDVQFKVRDHALYFESKHPFNVVRGETHALTGRIEIDIDDLSGGIYLDLSLPVNGFQTTPPGAASYLPGFLGAGTYPDLTIHAQSMEVLQPPSKSSPSFRAVLRPELTLRGIVARPEFEMSCYKEVVVLKCHITGAINLNHHLVGAPAKYQIPGNPIVRIWGDISFSPEQ